MTMALNGYPEEQRLVGKILTGYGDLEYLLAECMGKTIDDRQAAIRSLFRLRGGNVRLQVADAIIRPRMDAIGLKDSYDAALGGFRYSTKIRNQYAHCHWLDTGKQHGLFFTDLQTAAETAIGSLTYSMRHIDAALLKKQDCYLEYTFDWFSHLGAEYEKRAGRLASHDRKAPQIIGQPPLHNPREEHPLPRHLLGDQQPQEEQAQE
jgi:hypothetical protein